MENEFFSTKILHFGLESSAELSPEEDFARHIIAECYNLEKMMGSLANYFDYEAFARELFKWDYSMGADGNVFRRI